MNDTLKTETADLHKFQMLNPSLVNKIKYGNQMAEGIVENGEKTAIAESDLDVISKELRPDMITFEGLRKIYTGRFRCMKCPFIENLLHSLGLLIKWNKITHVIHERGRDQCHVYSNAVQMTTTSVLSRAMGRQCVRRRAIQPRARAAIGPRNTHKYSDDVYAGLMLTGPLRKTCSRRRVQR